MKIYILHDDKSGYDDIRTMAICANNSKQARRIARSEAEKHYNFSPEIWENPERTSCHEFILKSPAVIMTETLEG